MTRNLSSPPTAATVDSTEVDSAAVALSGDEEEMSEDTQSDTSASDWTAPSDSEEEEMTDDS